MIRNINITFNCLFLFFCSISPLAAQQGTQPFAVVELFTSEGCSSCPPAESFLAKIDDAAEKGNLPVYVLSFHVDYWDDLGWTDPYASKANTQRQRVYARINNSDRIYTPQMIVNGKIGFSGFNFDMAQKTIDQSLKEDPELAVKVTPGAIRGGNKLQVNYAISNSVKNAQIAVALVERKVVNFIQLGENAGKMLRHRNVVRYFESDSLRRTTGSMTVEIPEGLNLKNSSLIAFVQDKKNMKILGASKTAL